VAVSTLPEIARAEPGLLAAAGASLPLDEWLPSLTSRQWAAGTPVLDRC
jgi:hypothetical protein